jgi:hypothetical protein
MPSVSFPLPESLELSFRFHAGDFSFCDICDLKSVTHGVDRYGVPWDFNVWLPSRGQNLQRDLCWTDLQKEQLIWSLIRQRPIPPIAVNQTGNSRSEMCRQVIDGKQRIHAIADFLNNVFPIYWKDQPFYCDDLPAETFYFFAHRPLYSNYAYRLTEDQKVEWFLQINFAGTPQDEDHCRSLIRH